MVPQLWQQMEGFPLNASGKLDRKALPPVIGTAQGSWGYVAPGNALDRGLVELWEEVLGVAPIGITDNFFSLGGDSLLAIRVISRIRQRFSLDLSIRTLFLHPQLNQLSSFLADQKPGLVLPPLTAHSRPDRLPLSYSQERLWFIDRLEGSIHYHIPCVLRLEGDVSLEDWSMHFGKY